MRVRYKNLLKIVYCTVFFITESDCRRRVQQLKMLAPKAEKICKLGPQQRATETKHIVHRMIHVCFCFCTVPLNSLFFQVHTRINIILVQYPYCPFKLVSLLQG